MPLTWYSASTTALSTTASGMDASGASSLTTMRWTVEVGWSQTTANSKHSKYREPHMADPGHFQRLQALNVGEQLRQAHGTARN
eukprot:8432489-Alexandrium_andersonii.AAC.1